MPTHQDQERNGDKSQYFSILVERALFRLLLMVNGLKPYSENNMTFPVSPEPIQWFPTPLTLPPLYVFVLVALEDNLHFEINIANYNANGEWILINNGKEIFSAIGKRVKYWSFLPNHPELSQLVDSTMAGK